MRPTTSLSVLAALLAGISPGVRCDETPSMPPFFPTIHSISYAGNGCTSETVDYIPSSEQGAPPNVALRNFSVQSGKGIERSLQTANCGLHLNLGKGPAGYHFALSSVLIRGQGRFSPGSSLMAYVTAFWSQDASRTGTETMTLVFDGGRDGPLALGLGFNRTNAIWSPCIRDGSSTGLLNVNVRLSARAATADGFASFGGEAEFENSNTRIVSESFNWMWMPCRPPTETP